MKARPSLDRLVIRLSDPPPQRSGSRPTQRTRGLGSPYRETKRRRQRGGFKMKSPGGADADAPFQVVGVNESPHFWSFHARGPCVPCSQSAQRASCRLGVLLLIDPAVRMTKRSANSALAISNTATKNFASFVMPRCRNRPCPFERGQHSQVATSCCGELYYEEEPGPRSAAKLLARD